MELFTPSVVSEAMDRNCIVLGNLIQTLASNCNGLAETAIVKAPILLRPYHIESCSYTMAVEMYVC